MATMQSDLYGRVLELECADAKKEWALIYARQAMSHLVGQRGSSDLPMESKDEIEATLQVIEYALRDTAREDGRDQKDPKAVGSE